MSNFQDGRYQGKRFTSLLVVVTILALGFFFGPPENFGAFSMSLGALYGAYLTGQSATDYAKAKNASN